MTRVTDERLAELLRGADAYERLDSYGHMGCGCSWDSGPFSTPCEKHNQADIALDLLRDAADALAGDPLGERIRRFLDADPELLTL